MKATIKWSLVCLNFYLYIVFYLTFLTALQNGGQVVVYTNSYGEQSIEFIFLSIIMVIMFLGFIYEGVSYIYGNRQTNTVNIRINE